MQDMFKIDKKKRSVKKSIFNYRYLFVIMAISCLNEGWTENHKNYWYNGQAELSSYELKQARYGETYEGKAVLIYVTESFDETKLVKSDITRDDNVSVMKLNFVKSFNTETYPYRMINSTYFPVENGSHSLKVVSNSQEWCGSTFMELRNRGIFEIDYHSYFEDESVKDMTLDKTWIEDDLWTLIRVAPKRLPLGKFEAIPSFFFLRFRHKDIKAYSCEAHLEDNENLYVYSLKYPELNRLLEITFEKKFPFTIRSWKETGASGWGDDKKMMTTEGKLITTIRSDYWNKSSESNQDLMKRLGVE